MKFANSFKYEFCIYIASGELVIKKSIMVITMDNENIQSNISVDEIGSIAMIIDTEMTILERMKIKKKTLIRLFGALMFYLVVLAIFTVAL